MWVRMSVVLGMERAALCEVRERFGPCGCEGRREWK